MIKIKNYFNKTWIDEMLWFLVVLGLLMTAFSLGSLHERHVLEKATHLDVSLDNSVVRAWKVFQEESRNSAQFFASKNGTKVYPIGCKAGNRIKEENRVFFRDIEQAQETGYSLSFQC